MGHEIKITHVEPITTQASSTSNDEESQKWELDGIDLGAAAVVLSAAPEYSQDIVEGFKCLLQCPILQRCPMQMDRRIL